MNARDLLHVRRMGMVTRFHTIPTVRPQTTSHHSGNVALLLTLLWPGVTVQALRLALVHDLGESFTGDVPAPTKWALPDLGERLDAVESTVLEGTGLWDEIATIEEAWWLSFCDTLDLCLYCLEEMSLGNMGIHQQFENGLQGLDAKLARCPDAGTRVSMSSLVSHMASLQPLRTKFSELFAVPFHTKEGAHKLLGDG